MPPLLEARNVTKVFGGGLFQRNVTVALQDFSLVIEGNPPSITAIVGESGSGKTTLARLLLGLISPTSGKVLYEGKDLQTLTGAERRRYLRDIQVIFQDPYEVYNPFYKVDHVLETPIAKFGLAPSRQKARALMEETLQAVGLRPEETLGRYPHQLSGGQRQRVMVARALLLRPRLIIADEPVSMVDASLRATILENLRELNQRFGISLIYITHDLTTAYQISENIVVLYRGSVAEAGDVELVVKSPQHPYTRLLVNSIPLPDPRRSWEKERLAEAAGAVNGSNTGCKFADRCPHVMPICRQSPPPLYRTDPHRVAACYLYRDAAVIENTEMGSVFVTTTPQAEPRKPAGPV
ncbi:MAG: ABC transporter ATP-binding protein [Chloroflexi bacterium]|nr:ABC transporter ATP-binding protein [Chloroflexota bacterium]